MTMRVPFLSTTLTLLAMPSARAYDYYIPPAADANSSVPFPVLKSLSQNASFPLACLYV